MKYSYLLAIIIIVSVALGIGWFFDNRVPQLTITPLQVPDNIDYYLSNVNYRSMNQQGSVHYLFKTPYLEHYIREDISLIQQPAIQLNGEKSQWLIQAEKGKLLHKKESFELQEQVELERNSTHDPMLVSTDLMVFKAKSNLVEIPRDMTVITDTLNLQATDALLDINQDYYKFTGVKATYQPANSGRKPHANS